METTVAPELLPFSDPGTPVRWTRPVPVRVTHVDLAITLDLEERSVSGTVEHRCVATDPGATAVMLDQHDLEIQAVQVDGAPVEWQLEEGQLRVPLPGPGSSSRVRVTFRRVDPAKGLYFIAADPARGRVAMCWTQGAMEDHSWWFPCLDTPNNLSTYRIAIRHRDALRAAAGGVLAEESVAEGWRTSVYVQDRPHVLYLLTVVCGGFARIEQEGAPVPLAHLLPTPAAPEALAMFRATPRAISVLAEEIGVPFPWQRYGHAVVHGFMWGGMENTTLTTITDRVVMSAEVQAREDVGCDSLVVHELVHQWFGDLVTMKAWSDIWLNESFATYYEARGSARIQAELAGDPSAARIAAELELHLWHNRQAYLEQEQGRYRRPLVTNRYQDAYELFDRVAYEKGSLVLHHLGHVLGWERFRAGIRLYLARHAHQLVETADLRRALADATGEPCDWFFAQWLERPGHPRLRVGWTSDPKRQQLVVTIEQLQATAQADALYRLPCAIAWRDAAGLHRQDVVLSRVLEHLILPASGAVAWVVLDPDGHVPAEWEEQDSPAALRSRLEDAALGVTARARAAYALGERPPAPATTAVLARLAGDAQAPELVRLGCLEALGTLATPAAAEALRALLAEAPARFPGRLRRVLARVIGGLRGNPLAPALAELLVVQADADPSRWCAGDFLAARGALEIPGATPLLRQRMAAPSWNDRLRAGCVRGLGASAELPAVDAVAEVLAGGTESDAVLAAACDAAGRLGARHLSVRLRLRLALERHLAQGSIPVRAAAARGLAALEDPAGAAALGRQQARELFGNVGRVLREALARLGKIDAGHTAQAQLRERLEEGERERKRLAARVEALEQRLLPSDGS